MYFKMAKEISMLDTEKEFYLSTEWKREQVIDFLKDKKVLNVETLEDVIRFWYINEN